MTKIGNEDVKFIVKDYKTRIISSNRIINSLRNNDLMQYERDFWLRRNTDKFIPKYKKLVNKKGVFKTGLLPRVVTLLESKNLSYRIVDKRNIKDKPDTQHVKTMISGMRIGGQQLELRDYQKKALIQGVKNTRGIFEIGTGGGKTVIIASILLSWWKKSLIVIDKKDLAYQLRDHISDYTDQDVGFIGDGKWNPKKFTVGIDRTLLSNKNEQKKKDYLDSVRCLIFDEVHHLQSKTWRKICRSTGKASIRFGFSATPETSPVKLSDGTEGNKNEILEGYIGPKLISISAGELVERGWLAEPTVYFIQNKIDFDGNVLNDYQKEYGRTIVKDDVRNGLIARVMARCVKLGLQAVGFVRRKLHGRKICELLEELGVSRDDFAFVHGNSPNRDKLISDFKSGDLKILFGTILSEGMDFHCDVGINIEGGKNQKQAKQKIGRILRKGAEDDSGDIDPSVDEHVDYIEFTDKFHPHFQSHANKRKESYKNEGFKIVPISTDSAEAIVEPKG